MLVAGRVGRVERVSGIMVGDCSRGESWSSDDVLEKALAVDLLGWVSSLRVDSCSDTLRGGATSYEHGYNRGGEV